MPKISQFPSGGVAQNTDLIPIVRSGGDYTITGYNLASLASYGQAYVGTFTATAGQTVFTLPASPGSLANLSISVDGSTMVPGTDYTWTTPTTLTFTTGLSSGQTVLYRYTTSVPVGTSLAGGINGQLQYNNSGVLNGTTIGGDATLVATTGVLTVTKTNGVAFAASATTNTTVTGNITYTQGGTGATSRTVTSKLQESVSIVDFGAVTGGTDCGSALQAAHDALPANGGTILVPAASTYYAFNSAVTFTKPVRLVGQGWYGSEFYTTTFTGVLISTTAKLDVENLYFAVYSTSRTTATIIYHTSGSASHNGSTFRNVRFDGGNYCYRTQSANAFIFDGCTIAPQGAYGLYLENLSSSDTGDSFITNCTFSGASSTVSVAVVTTSGLYITGNKFNTAVTGHLLISSGANNVGDFTVQGNSFEGHTSYGIQIVTSGGVVTKNLITGNQFSSGSAGVTMNHIVIGSGCKNTTITGNTFNSTSSSETVHTGISIASGSVNTTMTGNAFHQIYNGIVAANGANPNLGLTMTGNRWASDVTIPFVGDDQANLATNASSKEIAVARYIQDSPAGTLTSAFSFKGTGTLEIMIYGTAQGVGTVNYSRKVALYNNTTTNDINAAVNQGSASTSLSVALTTVSGATAVQVAKTGASTLFTGMVEVIARGQITSVVRN